MTAINQDVDHQAWRTTNVEVKKNGKLAIGRFSERPARKAYLQERDEPLGSQCGYQAIADGKRLLEDRPVPGRTGRTEHQGGVVYHSRIDIE